MIQQKIEVAKMNLNDLTKEWQAIENRDERNAFYDDKIFPGILEVVVPREQQQHPETYTHLILPVGLSPEPLILSIRILNPEKVYLLYTKVSEKFLDRIVRDSNLSISQVDKDEINDINVPEIYQRVKGIYDKWGQPEKVAVDITGGKKSMVGGCALAGSLIGARLFYVDSQFNRDFGKPEPGSERLMILENPYDVFGDLKLERAKALFTQMDFIGAQRILYELQQETSTPQRYEALTLLCEAYSAWDDWKMDLAFEKMKQSVEIVDRYARLDPCTPLASKLPYLRKQLLILTRLQQSLESLTKSASELSVLTDPESYLPIMGSLRAGAIRQESRGKLDVAALLWYRLIELLSQQRLSGYGIQTSNPDYSQVQKSQSDLLSNYQEVVASKSGAKSKSNGVAVTSLPSPISLIDGYTLLKALQDPFAKEVKLQEVRGKVEARDHGLFAHGFKPLDEKNYTAFRDLAERLTTLFREIDTKNCDFWNECSFIASL